MKTPTVTPFFFPRLFTIRQDKVVWLPSDPRKTDKLPMISRTHVFLTTLKIRMDVWVELLHEEDNPVGDDRLHINLTLSLSTVWIRRPVEELLHTTCDSTRQFHLWLTSVRNAMVAANHLAQLPRFPDGAIRLAFAPLFDTVAQLDEDLKGARAERRRLWEEHTSIMWMLPRGRFTVGLS